MEAGISSNSSDVSLSASTKTFNDNASTTSRTYRDNSSAQSSVSIPNSTLRQASNSNANFSPYRFQKSTPYEQQKRLTFPLGLTIVNGRLAPFSPIGRPSGQFRKRSLILLKSDPSPYSHILHLPRFTLHEVQDLHEFADDIDEDDEPASDDEESADTHKHSYVDLISQSIAHSAHSLLLQMRMSWNLSTAILTRYATPKYARCSQIIVDVLELRGRPRWLDCTIRLRANRDCTLMIKQPVVMRQKYTIRLKEGKVWGKKLNHKPMESISIIEDGKELSLGIVGRWHRPIPMAERRKIRQRFEEQYSVPAIERVEPGTQDLRKK